MLQNNPALKSKIDQLWNKFWAGGIANPLTAIEQITYWIEQVLDEWTTDGKTPEGFLSTLARQARS